MPSHKKNVHPIWLTSLLLLLSSLWYHLPAQQKNQPSFKRCPVNTINYEQGLMNSSIKGIITDGRGFTWVATSSGLQRYNGYALQAITPVAGNDTILLDYTVYFSAAKNGSILIGYRNGVLEYSAAINSFKKIISLQPGTGSNSAIMPVEETAEGIWCFEENKGIIVYSRHGEVLYRLPAVAAANVTNLLLTEGYDITRKLVTFNSRYIFIRISPNKVLEVNTATHQVRELNSPGATIIGLECDESKLFIASADGLAFMRLADGIFSEKILYSRLTDGQVNRSAIELSRDHMLLVSVEKQLFEFDTACHLKREIISQSRAPLMKTGYIQQVYEDSLRRLWLVTNQDIMRIQNAEAPFAHFIYINEKENFIKCIYYDKEKNIVLAGSFAGAIQLFDSSGNTLLNKPLADKKISHILSIEKISQDHYLILTQENGLFNFCLSTRQLSPVNVFAFPLFAAAVKSNLYSSGMQKVNDSTIFISTKSNVFRCAIQKNKIVSAEELVPASLLNGDMVSCFIFSSLNTLWVATQPGAIIKIDSRQPMKATKIQGKYLVRCIAEDEHHHILTGTEKGLLVYDTAGKLLKYINRETGLLSDFIYALLPAGAANDFFVSTNFGLSLIAASGRITNYTRELGLQENEFNTQSATMSPGGKLFFGGVNGITAFYPATLAVTKDSSLLNITRLVINDSLYNSFGGPWTGDTITLAYNQNHLQFDIAATGLLNAGEYQYRYRIKGLDGLWQITQHPTDIRYTLQPGKYLLEINGSPVLFSGNSIYKKLFIIISPPWWTTWWFVVIALLAAALIIFGITYFVLREKYKLKLKKLEISQQLTSERERISRELHDNIGSQLSYISSNIDWLVETPLSFSKDDQSRRLSVINETAKSLVADLRETIWAMKKECMALDELADRLKSFLQSQCVLQPQTEMLVSEKIERNYSFSPTEALNVFRVCQEAIVNCFRHAKAGKICFSIQSGAEQEYSFTITDDGKGFNPHQAYDGHYGLENMKHRAHDSGATLVIRTAPAEGTSITISKAARTNIKGV